MDLPRRHVDPIARPKGLLLLLRRARIIIRWIGDGELAAEDQVCGDPIVAVRRVVLIPMTSGRRCIIWRERRSRSVGVEVQVGRHT